jgi:hypothetical protein
VPAATSRVVMEDRPAAARVGRLVSLAAAIGVAALWLAPRRRIS